MPPIPALSQPLSDDHVGLRFTAERDIPEILIAYQDDPKLHVRLGMVRPPSGAELGQELEGTASERARGARAKLAIVDPPADDCLGEIIIHGIDWNQGRASVGIWVASKVRGKGVARRALRLTARWLFDAWGIERLTLLTDPDNEAMLRAAKAAGFVYEGILRSYGHERGRRCDLASLSLLPSDLAPEEPAMSIEGRLGSKD
jgi:RimJ/RimL family protein N-acetyltransferase